VHRIRTFVLHNAVPVVSVLAALVTCAFVPPTAAYAQYLDWSTLARLAAMLAVVAALREAGVFQALAAALAARTRTARALVSVLVGVTALASMFVTNDMALLGLLPLSAASLLAVGRRDLIARTFVLQGVAANLCGMLLPFGNPQNIYLVECFSIGFGPFVSTMAAPFALSAALLAACCFFAADARPVAVSDTPVPVPFARTLALAGLLAVCVASILGAVPAVACLLAVFGALLFIDRGLFARTDWGLIVTFAAFFVFSGNLARIDAVRDLFAGALAGGAFVPAALLSQLISNVPAAVVLSRFTADWPGLLAGVNVGGAGTPVASLATLIVITQFQHLTRTLPSDPANRTFMPLLLALNAAFLAILLVAGIFLNW